MNNCSDTAYTPDCISALKNGLCNANLSGTQTIANICRKTCGFCSNNTTSLTCNNIKQSCNTGTCSSTTFFNQISIQCTCPTGLTGTYCQTRI